MIYVDEYERLARQLKELFEQDDDKIVVEMLQGIDCYIQGCVHYTKGEKNEALNRCFTALQYIGENAMLITNGDTLYGKQKDW